MVSLAIPRRYLKHNTEEDAFRECCIELVRNMPADALKKMVRTKTVKLPGDEFSLEVSITL